MDKYSKSVREVFKPKKDVHGQHVVEPFRDAQKALQKARFSDQLKEEFFTDVYNDIIADLFIHWLKSEPHAIKEREHYYYSALALGSVKQKMVQYEMSGRNAEFSILQKKEQEAQEEDAK